MGQPRYGTVLRIIERLPVSVAQGIEGRSDLVTRGAFGIGVEGRFLGGVDLLLDLVQFVGRIAPQLGERTHLVRVAVGPLGPGHPAEYAHQFHLRPNSPITSRNR
ncbi:hypothetical protein IU476_07990 [Nocardia blacklockiae]|nr:hypothetical protein [Nocardia blacklockiae]